MMGLSLVRIYDVINGGLHFEERCLPHGGYGDNVPDIAETFVPEWPERRPPPLAFIDEFEETGMDIREEDSLLDDADREEGNEPEVDLESLESHALLSKNPEALQGQGSTCPAGKPTCEELTTQPSYSTNQSSPSSHGLVLKGCRAKQQHPPY